MTTHDGLVPVSPEEQARMAACQHLWVVYDHTPPGFKQKRWLSRDHCQRCGAITGSTRDQGRIPFYVRVKRWWRTR